MPDTIPASPDMNVTCDMAAPRPPLTDKEMLDSRLHAAEIGTAYKCLQVGHNLIYGRQDMKINYGAARKCFEMAFAKPHHDDTVRERAEEYLAELDSYRDGTLSKEAKLQKTARELHETLRETIIDMGRADGTKQLSHITILSHIADHLYEMGRVW